MKRDVLLFVMYAVVLLIGLISRTPPLTFLAFSMGLVTLIGRGWARWGTRWVTLSRETPGTHFMIGDTLDLSIQLDNPTPLPFPWVELSDAVPSDGLEFEQDWHGVLQIRTGLSWFQRVRRRYRVRLTRRGYYRIGPSLLRVWDPLGLSFSDRIPESSHYLTVYPRVFSLRQLGITADHPFGDPDQARWLYPDPLSITGVRSYQSGDPMNMIHWPATAATGELMTRVLEGTHSPELIILLNVATIETAWIGIIVELLELSIATAASVVQYALDAGFKVGLYSNGNQMKDHNFGFAPPLTVPVSGHPEQIRILMEALARAGDQSRELLRRTMDRHIPDHPGATWVIVSSLITRDIRERMERDPRPDRFVLLYTGETPLPPLPAGVKTFILGGKERWRQLEAQ